MLAISEHAIARLSLYRRLLDDYRQRGSVNVFSHQLAESAAVTAAQVRRDLMAIGYAGSPRHGYEVEELIRSIDDFLDAPGGQNFAVIGVGNLGRALMAFFANRRPKLKLVAAFDQDPDKTGRVIHGCKVHSINDLAKVVKSEGLSIAVLAVPASAAQSVSELCVTAGLTGVVNFAPVRLRLTKGVYVANVDLTSCLERVAYFARKQE